MEGQRGGGGRGEGEGGTRRRSSQRREFITARETAGPRREEKAEHKQLGYQARTNNGEVGGPRYLQMRSEREREREGEEERYPREKRETFEIARRS